MNQEQTQNVFIGLLAAGLILLGGGMYLFSMQLKTITRLLQTQSQTGSNLDQSCITSGGSLQNSVCTCGRDYFLENGKCMGQDGLTQKELEEIKAGQPTQSKIAVEQYCDTEAGSTGLCFNHPKSWSVSQYNDSFTSGQMNLAIGANAAGGRVTIERLHEGQRGLKGARVSAYPGLYELGELCSDDDGITCPQYPYYLTLDGDQTAFAVRVYYRFEDRAEIQPLIDTILLSLETGP